jgi:8-oxo-dGTP diphosphatase
MRSVADIDWDTWEPVDRAVLCFIIQNGHILLIHKKRGIGSGKINGPGGRLEPGETPLQAAIRELEEEVGLTPHAPKKFGELSFIFADGYSLHGTIFVSQNFSGEMTETEEAVPFWCPVDTIPYDNMWKDDPYWLPEVIAGNHIRGFFIFNGDDMVSSRIFVYRTRF